MFFRCVLKYDSDGAGKSIELAGTGAEYSELLELFEGECACSVNWRWAQFLLHYSTFCLSFNSRRSESVRLRAVRDGRRNEPKGEVCLPYVDRTERFSPKESQSQHRQSLRQEIVAGTCKCVYV
jgi:hypothetical protein